MAGCTPTTSASSLIEEVRFAIDSALEGDGLEPLVPDERKPTRASVTFERYRRLSRSETCARRPVAAAIRADTVVGGTRYSANLQCPRLSH